jgi:hypothetical protein
VNLFKASRRQTNLVSVSSTPMLLAAMGSDDICRQGCDNSIRCSVFRPQRYRSNVGNRPLGTRWIQQKTPKCPPQSIQRSACISGRIIQPPDLPATDARLSRVSVSCRSPIGPPLRNQNCSQTPTHLLIRTTPKPPNKSQLAISLITPQRDRS